MSEQAAPGVAPLDLFAGRARATGGITVRLSERDGASLHDKMRQAYWWITNNAVICPYYDIEYGVRSHIKNAAADELALHDDMSYSSFVLVPLLTLFTCRRALLIGGPGRGKTTSAVLMALLAGMSRDEVRRSILRGHPQLTVSDMLGAPLPADMMRAEAASEIKVAWRGWITERVKIVDEYNRIPTRTQSALLSLMAEGFAEMYDQYVHTGRSSWFLTANDDLGGGTFAVIEALKDRIDVVVRAVPFNSHFASALVKRIESGASPEDLIPRDIIFSSEELDAIYDAIAATPIGEDQLARLAFFLGQLDFCRMASPRFEFMNKDTLRLAGHPVASVCNERCPLDKREHLCTQTENGVSARAYLTCLHLAKALAYFRGVQAVELEDFRQIVPWVLHDKLIPNARSPFFEARGNAVLLHDRVAWIRAMFDRAMAHFDTHRPLHYRVKALRAALDASLKGVPRATALRQQGEAHALMAELMKEELSGAVHEDLIQLKAIYSHYQNYLRWLDQGGRSG